MIQKSLSDTKELKPIVESFEHMRNKRLLDELYDSRINAFNKLMDKLGEYPHEREWLCKDYREKVYYIDTKIRSLSKILTDVKR